MSDAQAVFAVLGGVLGIVGLQTTLMVLYLGARIDNVGERLDRLDQDVQKLVEMHFPPEHPDDHRRR